MNGNDMEKKHEHKKEVVNKESTESHEKQMEMKHAKILAIAYPSYPNHSFFTNDGNGISISSNVSWF